MQDDRLFDFQPSSDNWSSQHACGAALANLLPCFGGLVVRSLHTPDQSTRVASYSGCFMEHLGTRFWVTAGHVLHEVEKAFQSPDIQIREILLRDGLPMVDPDAASIPLQIQGRYFAMDIDGPPGSPGSGLDFGLVALDEATCELLDANPGAGYLDAEDSQEPLQAHAWGLYVLGIPGERARRTSETNLAYEIRCLPARVLHDCPSGLTKCERAIYAQILDRSPGRLRLKSIRGMSGGPVFAIEPRGSDQWCIRLVGVLSAWHGSSRTIRVTPMADVLVSIEHALWSRMRERLTRDSNSSESDGPTRPA